MHQLEQSPTTPNIEFHIRQAHVLRSQTANRMFRRMSERLTGFFRDLFSNSADITESRV